MSSPTQQVSSPTQQASSPTQQASSPTQQEATPVTSATPLTRVRLNCQTPNDGMPEVDAYDREFTHVSPREFLLAPGAIVPFGSLDPVEIEQGLRPAKDNLYTYNPILDSCHAELTTGKYRSHPLSAPQSIFLRDLGSSTGTYVNHMRPGKGKNEYKLLKPYKSMEVESGALIQFGRDPYIVRMNGQQIVCRPPSWTLIVEPYDPEFDKKLKESMDKKVREREEASQSSSALPSSVGGGSTR
ncbi:uncharacterized protein BKCO1_7500011 [Diplodia corticola]|uniref:FHA domain-containing protein n=1 Tax=Diplodia corticola TaxID=236234 RepID=A0A1J9QMF9_9PEZI|nr:uncharacterized protein BKCO1_7500011 [Diplodia corticola]OJD29672.1 hypothetical protein BKCO1_7500011 [Diplodia corticola]